MLVFRDLETNDELFSDAYKFVDDGNTIRVQSTMVDPDKVGEINIGANASAEEEAECYDDDQVAKVNNIASHYKLQEMGPLVVKDLKAYAKRLIDAETDAEKKTAIKESLKKYVTDVVEKRKEDKNYYSVYKSQDSPSFETGMLVLAYYDGEAPAPTFMFFKQGLIEEKL